MFSKTALLRSTFAFFALIVCIGLSFRPIPDIFSGNDTGRYLANQSEACNAPALADSESTLTQRAFDLMARPACWAVQPIFFLFLTSFSLPLAFILFGDWHREGALLLALGLLCSVIGFELMTNALRQAASLIFLLAAFSCNGRLRKIIAVVAALLLHDSNWIFAPLVFLVGNNTSPKLQWRNYYLLWAIPLAAIAAALFELRFGAQYHGIAAFLLKFTTRYSEEESKSFLIFMILPVYWVFTVRWLEARPNLTRGEKIVLLYTSIIFVATTIWFPYITYRFAMTAFILQILVTMRAVNLSVRSSFIILCGLVVHFIVFAAIAKNVSVVING